MEEKKIEAGNLDPENIEETKIGKVKVGDKEYQATAHKMKDGSLKIEVPESLNEKGKEDELEAFLNKKGEISSLFGIANKEKYEANLKQKELEEKERKLNQREAELEMRANSKKAQNDIPSLESLVMKKLNLNDPEELDDISRSEYLKANDWAIMEQRKIIEKNESEKIGQQTLITKFINGGGDYNALVTFANQLQAPITPTLINAFNKQNKTSVSSAFQNLKEVQKQQIDFITPSGVVHKTNKSKAFADGILNIANKKLL